MRSQILRFGLLSTLALSSLAACDYEWKEAPPKREIEEAVDQEEEPAAEEAAPEAKSEEKPSIIPTFEPGKPYAGSTTVPADAKMIDMLNLAATEQAILSTNVPGADVSNIFDGNPETLFRSPDINPLITTIALKNPTKIRGIRVRSTYSDYGVAVQIDSGERLILEPIPDGDWATLVWPQGVTAKTITVQTLRKIRDNVVHLNEIEIYQ